MRSIDGDDDSYDEIDKKLWKIWRNVVGQYHRDGNRPARIFADGSVFYYKDGNPHRDGDLPAVIYTNGTVFYYKNDRYHRDGGNPAIIWYDGTVEYWIDGVKQE